MLQRAVQSSRVPARRRQARMAVSALALARPLLGLAVVWAPALLRPGRAAAMARAPQFAQAAAPLLEQVRVWAQALAMQPVPSARARVPESRQARAAAQLAAPEQQRAPGWREPA